MGGYKKMNKVKIELEGYIVIEKRVRVLGNSAMAGVPRTWLGKRVKLVLLEDLPEIEQVENNDAKSINRDLYLQL